MNVLDIQKRVNALAVAMAAKGLATPKAQFQIESDAEFCVYLNWNDPVAKARGDWMHGDIYKFLRGETAYGALDEADAFLASLPSPDEAKFKRFMEAVAFAVDQGRENGIDAEFINPLQKTLKKLSENALTFQGGAA